MWKFPQINLVLDIEEIYMLNFKLNFKSCRTSSLWNKSWIIQHARLRFQGRLNFFYVSESFSTLPDWSVREGNFLFYSPNGESIARVWPEWLLFHDDSPVQLHPYQCVVAVCIYSLLYCGWGIMFAGGKKASEAQHETRWSKFIYATYNFWHEKLHLV